MSPLRRLIKLYDTEITKLDVRIAGTFKGDVGYETIQQLSGVLSVFAAVFPADDRQDSWTMRVIDP